MSPLHPTTMMSTSTLKEPLLKDIKNVSHAKSSPSPFKDGRNNNYTSDNDVINVKGGSLLSGIQLPVEITQSETEKKGTAPPPSVAALRTPFRVHSVDMLRGFTMAFAIFTGSRGSVYDIQVPGPGAPGYESISENPDVTPWYYPVLAHSLWAGCTVSDLLIPFFHTTMGTGMAFMLRVGRFKKVKKSESDSTQTSLPMFSISEIPNEVQKIAEEKRDKQLWSDVIRRSLKLWIIGFLLQGRIWAFSIFSGFTLFIMQYTSAPFRDFIISQLRFPGVLQRYGLVYFFVSVFLLGCRGRREAIIEDPQGWYEDEKSKSDSNTESSESDNSVKVNMLNRAVNNNSTKVSSTKKKSPSFLSNLFFYPRLCLRAQLQVIYLIWPTYVAVIGLAIVCTIIKNNVNGAHNGLTTAETAPPAELVGILAAHLPESIKEKWPSYADSNSNKTTTKSESSGSHSNSGVSLSSSSSSTYLSELPLLQHPFSAYLSSDSPFEIGLLDVAPASIGNDSVPDTGAPPTNCKAGDWKTKPGPDRCNPISLIDATVYGCRHLFDPINCFDPESILSIGTVQINLLLGLHAGMLVKYAREAGFHEVNTYYGNSKTGPPLTLFQSFIQPQHVFLLMNYLFMFFFCTTLALFFNRYDAPPIKPMWTTSFGLGACAAAFFMLMVFYILNDMWLVFREAEVKREERDYKKRIEAVSVSLTNNENVEISMANQGTSTSVTNRNLVASDGTLNNNNVIANVDPPSKQLSDYPLFFLRDFAFKPVYWLGRNAILSWILFNKNVDAYMCEYIQNWSFKVMDTDVVICLDGDSGYSPQGVALLSCFLHTAFVVLLMRWLFYRGTFFVL